MAGTIQALKITPAGVEQLARADAGRIREALQQPGSTLWLDICGLPPEQSEALIGRAFDFHALAIEDALQERHSPKVDDWDTYLYLVLQAANPETPAGSIELDVFLGQNYLVTHTKQPINALSRQWENCRQDPFLPGAGPARVLRGLVDGMADDFLALSDSLDEKLERVETRLFEDPQPELLEDIFMLKRVTLHLSRYLAPQRDVLMKVSRGDFAIIPKEECVYFRDVYDHFVRLHGLNESQLQLVVAARDTYLSVVNNRLNDVMKILTVITSLFMPLSFLTGFFGMNFFLPSFDLGIWTGKTAFGLMLALLAGLPLGMFLWMKRRRWL